MAFWCYHSAQFISCEVGYGRKEQNSDENQSVDISVDYDFDDEHISEGVYKITFSTTGREFKIHTTDYVEEGKEVGLTFFPEDIHVMSRTGY